MTEAELFIESFHALEGTLLKERKKSLFLLLERYKHMTNNLEFLREINEKLEPSTYLEETYKLEILLYFKRFLELFDILKSGNDVFASKIIHQSWFVENVFRNVSPEKFVREVFPELSIVIRSKILKQILKEFKEEKFIDALFDELARVYGLRPALILLSGCSVVKIKEILRNTTIKLSKAQLKLLHDKNPECILFHYDEFYKRGGDMSTLWNFDKYLSIKDPSLNVKLVEKYTGTMFNGLSYRGTRKYVAENKDAIMRNPKKYEDMGIFKYSGVVKEMGKDFPEFFKQSFPKKISELPYHNVRHMLKYYPKKKRYEVYFNTFQEVYKKNLFDSKEYMTYDLLEIIPNYEEREKWVEIYGNEVMYIQFKRSSFSVPELKEYLLKCDDVKNRQQLLRYLVRTCSINEDLASFLEVLKFFYAQLRNTDSDNIVCFLDTINETIKLEQLNEQHWKCIYEIILILDIRDSLRGQSTSLLFEYCKFSYKSGQSFEESVPIYLKSSNFEVENAEFRNDKFNDANFEKQFLELVLKYYPRSRNVKENTWKTNQIISRVAKWNKRHPNDKITVSKCENIVNNIAKSLDVNDRYCFNDELKSMKYLVCRENRIEELSDVYFNRLKNLRNLTMTKWFLKYHPEIFIGKLDQLIDLYDRGTQTSFMNYFKKYEHINLVRILTEHYTGKLIDKEEENKFKIVELLSMIMPKREFLNLLDKYVPVIDKMDLLNATEDQKNTFQIQISMAKSISFTNYQSEALPIILKYCRGDFLQPALLSLYSCFHRVPEKKLRPIVDVLLKEPVSLRKHSIFLAAMIFPIEMNKDLGEKIMNGKNDSIQKHLFTSSFKSFLKNPSEVLWKILEKYMECLTSNDKESLGILTKVHVVPEQYRNQLAIKAWNIFEKLSKKDNKSMQSIFDDFLRNIRDDDIRLLSDNFCLTAIESKLFIETHEANKYCLNFATKFIMYSDEPKNNIREILKILQKYKNNYPAIYTRSVIDTFFRNVFEKTMNRKKLRIIVFVFL